MERGKERAELRTGDLKRLLSDMEHQRDVLCDEAAKKQGEVDALERMIKRTYEVILDANKDEQAHKEQEQAGREKDAKIADRKEKNAKAAKENAPRKKKVEKVLDGIKNSGRTSEVQERARKARGKKTVKSK